MQHTYVNMKLIYVIMQEKKENKKKQSTNMFVCFFFLYIRELLGSIMSLTINDD